MNKTVVAALASCIVSSAAWAEDQKPESFLIVELANSAQISDGVLTLDGVDGSVLAFSDRPYRDTKTLPLSAMIDNWSKGENDLASDPPNAALTGIVDGEEVGVVLELSGPKQTGEKLSSSVQQLAGPDVTELQNVALMIDDICINGTSYCLMTGSINDLGGGD